MFDWLSWFTHMENTKPLVLVIFSITFIFILVYVLSNKDRSNRFESYKNIPFQEEDDDDGQSKDIKK